jgi:protein TonB
MSKIKFALALGLILAILPSNASAQETTASSGGATYLDFQVDRPAKAKSAVSPRYPERLLSANVEGEVLVQFVVDERGVADMSSFRVIRSTNNEFTESVKNAIRSMSFEPAESAGKKVRQVVQQPYRFAVKR